MGSRSRVRVSASVTFRIRIYAYPGQRTYCRIEQPAADTKEDPGIDHEAEPEG
jgi:hypothetical protein